MAEARTAASSATALFIRTGEDSLDADARPFRRVARLRRYKELEGRAVEVGGWRSREEALVVIEDAKHLQERVDREGG
jgi:inorganic pyrophosphatase